MSYNRSPYPEGRVDGTIQTVNNKVQNECHCYSYVLQMPDHLKVKHLYDSIATCEGACGV